MLTIADGGGRGGVGTPVFGWRNMWTAPYRQKMRIFPDLFSEHPCPPDSCTKICGVCPRYVVFDLETLRICQNLWYLAETPQFRTERGVNRKHVSAERQNLAFKHHGKFTRMNLVRFQFLWCLSKISNSTSLQKRVCTKMSFQYFVCNRLNLYEFCRKILACNVWEVGLSCPLSGSEIYQQL